MSETAKDDAANDDAEGGSAEGPQDGEDTLRRRYREALDRKIGKSGGGGRSGAHGPDSESMSATASAKTQRTFRRKSGG